MVRPKIKGSSHKPPSVLHSSGHAQIKHAVHTVETLVSTARGRKMQKGDSISRGHVVTVAQSIHVNPQLLIEHLRKKGYEIQ